MLEDVPLILLVDENNFLACCLRDECFSERPQRANALRIEDVGLHGVAAVVQVHGREDFVQVSVRDLGHLHVAKVKNIDVLLGVVGDILIAQHH